MKNNPPVLQVTRGRCSFTQRKLEQLLVCFREPFCLVEDAFLALNYRAFRLELDVKISASLVRDVFKLTPPD